MLKKTLVLCALIAVGVTASAQDLPRYPDVRIMVVIPEYDYELFNWPFFWQPLDLPIKRIFPGFSAQAAIEQALVEAGYRVVSQDQYAAQLYAEKGEEGARRMIEDAMRDPTGIAARALTAITGADILIAGQAFAEKGQERGRVYTARARVEARATVTSGTPQIIAVKGQDGSGADTSRINVGKVALHNAAAALSIYLVEQIGAVTGGPIGLAEAAQSRAQPSRVAVMPFDWRNQWGRVPPWMELSMPALLETELSQRAGFELVDRLNIDHVIQEQGFNIQGLVSNPGECRRLGGLLAADYLVFCRITEFAERNVRRETPRLFGGERVVIDTTEAIVKIHASFVETETGRVMASREGDGSATSFDGMRSRETGYVEGLEDTSASGQAARKAIRDIVDQAISCIPLMPRCPQCGADLVPDGNFCDKCGWRLEIAEPTCAVCGKKLRVGARFCPYCGARRELPQQPER